MSEAKDWQTKLGVYYDGKLVTPIEILEPSIVTPETPIHSTEDELVGLADGPLSLEFSMSVIAIGEVVKNLTVLQMTRTYFQIAVVEYHGDDWSFKSVAFDFCKINGSNFARVPSARTREPPMIRFGVTCRQIIIDGDVYPQ